MGISSAQIGSFFTKLIQKGDPGAAMAAGKGPVTSEWAAAHGYTQYRSPDIKITGESIKLAGEGASLYAIYEKRRVQKEHIKDVKRETKKKRRTLDEKRRMSRLLRRPSRERGIL